MEYIVTSWCNMLIIILFIQSQSWPVLGNTGVLWLWPAYKQWEFWAILAKLRPSDFEPYSSCLSKRGDVTKTKKSHHLNFCTLFFCYWVALCLMLFWVMELRGGRIWSYSAKIFSHFPCFRGCFVKLYPHSKTKTEGQFSQVTTWKRVVERWVDRFRCFWWQFG